MTMETNDTMSVTRDVRRKHSIAHSIDSSFAALERWLGYLGMGFLVGLMVMVVFEVSARYIFGMPLKGYIDIMEMMMAVLVFLSLAFCQAEGGNIRMELFMDKVLKNGRRYWAVETFHLLTAAVGFGVIAVYSCTNALNAYRVGDATMSIHLPIWPARVLVAVGAAVLFIRFILQLIQSLYYVWVGGSERDLLNKEVPL